MSTGREDATAAGSLSTYSSPLKARLSFGRVKEETRGVAEDALAPVPYGGDAEDAAATMGAGVAPFFEVAKASVMELSVLRVAAEAERDVVGDKLPYISRLSD